MSLLMTLTRGLLRFSPGVFRSVETVKVDLATRQAEATIPAVLRRNCQISRNTLEGHPVVTLMPHGKRSGIELLYIHGGAYIHHLVRPHWHIIRCLIEQTGATVTVPSYGLVPDYTVKQAYPFLEAVYRQVLARAGSRPVYVAGDSAGGALSLGLAITCRDQGLRLPDGLFLFAPFVDATLTNPEIDALQSLDPMLDVAGLHWCVKQWADGISLHDPRISPLYDSLANLPPIYVYQGAHDILAADARKLADKAASTNTRLSLKVYPDGFHVFVGATFTPEATDVFRDIGRIVRAGR